LYIHSKKAFLLGPIGVDLGAFPPVPPVTAPITFLLAARLGVTGFLVPPRNPEALAEAMLKMMSLPEEKRRAMGKAARKYVEDNFSLDRVVDMWEALYRELLERKGRKQ